MYLKKAVNILKGLEGCMVKFESEKKKLRNHIITLSKINKTLIGKCQIFILFIYCTYVMIDRKGLEENLQE